MVDPAKMENWEVMVHPSIVASARSIAVAPLSPLQHFPLRTYRSGPESAQSFQHTAVRSLMLPKEPAEDSHASLLSQVALASAELAAIPAGVMLLGSVATIWSAPPPKIVAHALQHLAGGIMLAAISMELVPPLP